jgi:RsiW-degrading membrane proteinase PrsW (M82 family)
VTTTEPTDVRAAQLEAIDQSGWGMSFRLWQPHNLAMWIWGLLVAAGALTLAQEYSSLPQLYRPSAIAGFVIWALYCVPWIMFLRHKDRYEREPAKLAIVGFAWGGLAATFALALPGNAAVLSLYQKVISPKFAATWGPAFTAPFVEETSKAAGFVLLILLAPRLVRTAYDGLILGAFVGLGFQVFEDWLYTVEAAAADLGSDQLRSTLQTVVLRGFVAGLFSHTLFSALFAMGIVWLVGRPNEPRRPLRGLVFIGVAVVAHGAWDAAAAASLLSMVAAAGIGVVAIVIGERWAARQERVWMRDLMAPEVLRGTITPAELEALAGSSRDRRRFVKAAPGHAHRHQARLVIHAATDVAEEIARAGGSDTGEVQFARDELLRVRTTS